jgi:thiosulfate reductase cytochrome b subunit
MWFFVVFAIPHIILVIADGWDTLRSMITGWSMKTPKADELQHEP